MYIGVSLPNILPLRSIQAAVYQCQIAADKTQSPKPAKPPQDRDLPILLAHNSHIALSAGRKQPAKHSP